MEHKVFQIKSTALQTTRLATPPPTKLSSPPPLLVGAVLDPDSPPEAGPASEEPEAELEGVDEEAADGGLVEAAVASPLASLNILASGDLGFRFKIPAKRPYNNFSVNKKKTSSRF